MATASVRLDCVELREHVRDVDADRLRTDEQLLRDLAVAASRRHLDQYVALARCQRLEIARPVRALAAGQSAQFFEQWRGAERVATSRAAAAASAAGGRLAGGGEHRSEPGARAGGLIDMAEALERCDRLLATGRSARRPAAARCRPANARRAASALTRSNHAASSGPVCAPAAVISADSAASWSAGAPGRLVRQRWRPSRRPRCGRSAERRTGPGPGSRAAATAC